MRVGGMLRALAHRNYRLYFIGQGVSLIGTWMQQVAMSWLVYRMTGQTFWYGLVLFCGQAPGLVLAPLAGELSDRWDRHRLVLLTQALAMLQAFALAALDFAGVLALWHVVALSLFIGVVNAFDITVRQAMLPQLLDDRADLTNAVALNSSLVNGARLVGPALGGLLVAWIHAGGCFLLNGLSFMAVLAALLALRLSPRPAPPRRALLAGLKEGFRYAFGFAPIRALLLLMAVVSLAGVSSSVLLPAYTDRNLAFGDHDLGAALLGGLMAASGVGALASALFLAARPTVVGLGRWIALSPALLGLALFGMALTPGLAVALSLLTVAGAATMLQMAATNSLLQTIVEEDKRGRVMSLYATAFLGVAPVGSLLAGGLADQIGLPWTYGVCGAVCLAGAAAFAARLPRLRQLVRPIYVRLNILPEAAPLVQPAAPPGAPVEAADGADLDPPPAVPAGTDG